MNEWQDIQETLYLLSIPGMVESIITAATEPLEDGIDASMMNRDVYPLLSQQAEKDLGKLKCAGAVYEKKAKTYRYRI